MINNTRIGCNSAVVFVRIVQEQSQPRYAGSKSEVMIDSLKSKTVARLWILDRS